MLAEIRGSCKQNREFANIAQKCLQNLANKKSVWSLCKVVQTKKTSHKVRGVLLREGLYKAFASCLSSAAVSGFLSSSSIFAASLSSLSVTAVRLFAVLMVREEIPRSLTAFSSSALGIRFPSASSSRMSICACAVLLSVLAVSVPARSSSAVMS